MANLEIYRRDDVTYDLEFKDENGAAQDITGYIVYFTVKGVDTDSDDNALIKKDIAIHTTPLEGKTEIALSNTDTDIPAGKYYYDIQQKDDSDKIQTLVKGFITIVQDITTRKND